jgi:carbonic anhydrase
MWLFSVSEIAQGELGSARELRSAGQSMPYDAVTHNMHRDTSSRRLVVFAALGVACVASAALFAGNEPGGATVLGDVGRWTSLAEPKKTGWFSSMRRAAQPTASSGQATADALAAAQDALSAIASYSGPVHSKAAAQARLAAKSQQTSDSAVPEQQELTFNAKERFPWAPNPTDNFPREEVYPLETPNPSPELPKAEPAEEIAEPAEPAQAQPVTWEEQPVPRAVAQIAPIGAFSFMPLRQATRPYAGPFSANPAPGGFTSYYPGPYAPNAYMAPSAALPSASYPLPAAVRPAVAAQGGMVATVVPVYPVNLCRAGKMQSPINIEVNVVPAALPVLGWQITGDASAAAMAITPASHAVGGAAPRLALVGLGQLGGVQAQMGVRGVSYLLSQLNVAAPSEHAIAGERADLEVQFVHATAANAPGQARYMVLSALVKKAVSSTPAVAELARRLKGAEAVGFRSELVALDLQALAMSVLGQTEAVDATATNAQSYFEYTGSFTAAPCTEGVSWVVTKNALAASQDDLETIARILGRAARPLQALNGRAVLDSRVAPA